MLTLGDEHAIGVLWLVYQSGFYSIRFSTPPENSTTDSASSRYYHSHKNTEYAVNIVSGICTSTIAAKIVYDFKKRSIFGPSKDFAFLLYKPPNGGSNDSD